jgi:hypothetical protein
MRKGKTIVLGKMVVAAVTPLMVDLLRKGW